MLPDPKRPIHKRIPTKEHCHKVAKAIRESLPREDRDRRAIIYLAGRTPNVRDDTDVEVNERQESNFFYTTGVDAPGYQFIYDLRKDTAYLIVPITPASVILWKGPPDSLEDHLQKFDVDVAIHDTPNDIRSLLDKISPEVMYTLSIATCTSRLPYLMTLIPRSPPQIDVSALSPALSQARLIKTSWEFAHIKHITQISSLAHIALMRQARFGMNEYELQALFEYECTRHGVQGQAYLPIIASGGHAATLHYTDNDDWIQPLADDPAKRAVLARYYMVLVDAGGEERCYGTDITRTWPVSGKFVGMSKDIYETVLAMQKAVLSRLKPGILWSEMQKLAHRVLVHRLLALGILRIPDAKAMMGVTEETLVELGIGKAFYPHGLGHSVGLDVHDVGGHDAGIFFLDAETRPFRRFKQAIPDTLPLQTFQVLTVEPGCYFNKYILQGFLDNPLYAPYFDQDKIAEYAVVGGVRIEDTVGLVDGGYDNFTICPKEVKDIEAVLGTA
ncbi:hypothetical protein BZG36_03951 [Bifiguratus adelaidae]|uniref:Aminopeptidase P N-terminal domain-containing protein n=1 Tax=Bifiguratus adelaidae TaxID=1938954 RepID=A0A261XZX3_9FUNG|nr:hypothetical protein BZG36_03951 [Bifiguratus adelaidae]